MDILTAYALCLKHGDTAFDVGANTGMTAKNLSQLVGPSGMVASFECHPVHFSHLAFLASRDGFNNILPFCRALSDKPGHVIMFSGSEPAAAQASTIVTDLANRSRLGSSICRLKVETDTLDRFYTGHGLRPALVKVDVEGAEAMVFAGARRLLGELKPHLVFEFGYGWSAGQVPGHFTMLKEFGYQMFLVDVMTDKKRAAQLVGLDQALITVTIEDLLNRDMGGNILAIHESKRADVLRGVPIHPFATADACLCHS